MKRIFFYLLWVPFFVFSACGRISSSNSDELTKLAIAKLQKSNTVKDASEAQKLASEAFLTFEDLKSGDPNGAHNFLLVGQALFNLSYINEAEVFLNLALNTLPNSGIKGDMLLKDTDAIHYTLYLLYKAKNNLELAHKAILPVKERYPQIFIQSSLDYGYLLFKNNNFADALLNFDAILSQAKEIRKKFPIFDLQEQVENAAYYAGEAHKKLGSPNDAIFNSFKLGAEAYPDNYNTLSRFVKLAKERGEINSLIDEYKTTSETDAIMALLLSKIYSFLEDKKLSSLYMDKFNSLTNAKK